MTPAEKRGPAPCANTVIRAEGVVEHLADHNIDPLGAEDFAAIVIASRYNLPPCVARLIANLSRLGGQCA